MNILKLLLIAVSGVALLLGWLLHAEVATNKAHQQKVLELAASLSEVSKLDAVRMQEQCAARAERVFKTQFRMRSQTQDRDGTDEHRSHFNKGLNKCLMEISTFTYTKENLIQTRSLLDAFELRDYASIVWSTGGGKLFLHLCKLYPPSESERNCASEDEYKSFVARFMP